MKHKWKNIQIHSCCKEEENKEALLDLHLALDHIINWMAICVDFLIIPEKNIFKNSTLTSLKKPVYISPSVYPLEILIQ